MKKIVVVGLILVGVGCSSLTTTGGYFHGRGGREGLEYLDPGKPIPTSQVALRAVGGGYYGDYGAALALGDISDSDAREDAAAAIKDISRSRTFNYGGRCQVGPGSFGQAVILMENPREVSLKPRILGFRELNVIIPPKSSREVYLPWEQSYKVKIYHGATGRFLDEETFKTGNKAIKKKINGEERYYDAIVSLDGI